MENMEKLINKKILITGGAGFIGSCLANKLANINCNVVVIDDLSSGKKENLNKAVKLYKADIRSEKIKEIFKKEKPQIIFHFAARPLVEDCYKNPAESISVNVMGTVNILEVCRQQKDIKSIIVVSSDKAYGKSEKLPYKETDPLRGDHPYDASKSAADLIARTYFTTYGLPIKITRFSNVFGPGDDNLSRIIPGIMEALLKNRKLLIRSNGKMIREYTFVDDIVDGCIKLANHNKNFGEAFNFSSNNIFSVLDIVKKTELALNKKVSCKILNIAKNEIPKQYLDWSKAKRILKWQPKVLFKDGVKKTYNWFKKYYEL